MTEDSKIIEQLKALEEKLLNPAVRKSSNEIFQLLAEDFIEFGASGKIYNKKETMNLLNNETSLKIKMLDFKVNILTPKSALVTYTAVKNIMGKNVLRSLRSSVWKKKGAKWQMVFHQGTALK